MVGQPGVAFYSGRTLADGDEHRLYYQQRVDFKQAPLREIVPEGTEHLVDGVRVAMFRYSQGVYGHADCGLGDEAGPSAYPGQGVILLLDRRTKYNSLSYRTNLGHQSING